jgi:hypothetical protein
VLGSYRDLDLRRWPPWGICLCITSHFAGSMKEQVRDQNGWVVWIDLLEYVLG